MVYIIDLPAGFRPQTVHQVPDVFSGTEMFARRLPTYAAFGFVVAFNKHQLAERIPDRKWAIAVNAKLDVRGLNEHARRDREQLAPVNDGPAADQSAPEAEGGAL
jgi:hypothetical protein